MAEKKISELPIIQLPSASALIPIVVDGNSVANTNAISASALASYIANEIDAARTSITNTFTNTQNFNGAVFLNGDVNIVGNLIGEVRNEINSLEAFTASLRTEVNGIEAYTESLKGTTLISGSAQISALGFSAATNGTVSSSAQITELPYIHSTTSSLNTFTGSVQSEVNALKTATSSYVVNSLTSSFVSYTELSQSFANFTSSVVNLHNDINIISSSLTIDSNNNYIHKQSLGDKDLEIHADSGVGISLTVDNTKTWRIDTNGNIITAGNYDIEKGDGTKVFNSLSKIHTYTGSIGRDEISGIEEYTASLKGAIEVNGQDVNVLGMITAQQFNVTYVSSSTLYQSGSTKFGDTSDDRHEFTGSVDISGSITVSQGNVEATSFSGSFHAYTNTLGKSTLTGGVLEMTSELDIAGYEVGLTMVNAAGNKRGSVYLQPSDGQTVVHSINGPLTLKSNTGKVEMTGSVDVTGGITGSLMATNNVVSSSTQISNYYKFAETASANTFYGNQTISGSLIVTASANLSGSVVINELTYPTSNFADGQYGVEVPTLGVNNVFTMEVPKTVYEYVKNDSGVTLPKGTPVHSTGTVGFNTLVIAASASNAATMPATFILAQDLDDEEEGLGIAIGAIQGIDTTGLTAGDAVYVGANGGFTQSKPTGSNLIQNLGIVTKVGVSGGGVVLGAGRSNDVPNIQQGYFWAGNSGSVATPFTTSSILLANEPVSSSKLHISEFAKLTSVSTFPSGEAGMLVASSSYGFTNLYMYDGSDWKWLVTGSIA
jgi:hypothetical protein